MPRRRAGTLLPLELEILRAAVRLADGDERFHGFGLAQALRGDGHRSLVAHGTLYKALARLQESGLLSAAWEAPDLAAEAGRPRRKLYAVTAAGVAALSAADRPAPAVRRATAKPSLS
jgi:PadR family transcriptional regulator, regulatory protein PadR